MEKEATNIVEYVEIINKLSEQRIRDSIKDDVILFRGQSDSTFELLPSIARKGKNETDESLLKYESDMITKAIGKNPDIFYEDKYSINLLVKLQHFGIPTRLLDVTYNSLVALYFACIDKDEASDGEVIVFRISGDNGEYVQYYNKDIVDIVAKTYQMQIMYPYNIISVLGNTNYIIENCKTEEEMDAIYDGNITNIIKEISVPIFVSPVELSERQKRQQGAFILFPNKVRDILGKVHFVSEICPMKKDDNRIIARIKISGAIKKELLDKLEFFGITEEFLFPDSPDIICKTIKENSLKRLGR